MMEDNFLQRAGKWEEEIQLLRTIIQECNLTEELKWGWPCYSYNKANVVLIHGFKDYFALLFFKGSLLHDENKLLIQQTENVQAGRQLRFKDSKEVIDLKPIIKAYVFEAIEVEKAGLKVAFKKTTDFTIPEEFKVKLDENEALKTAFEGLTAGRQKMYASHFAEPKQLKTRESRIESNIPRILMGKGLNDCICGLSHKKPNCDGTHKHLK